MPHPTYESAFMKIPGQLIDLTGGEIKNQYGRPKKFLKFLKKILKQKVYQYTYTQN